MSDDLGFVFHPPIDPRSPGYAALEVRLALEPTMQHFDPESVTLPTATRDGSLGHAVVTHPWRGPDRLDVCAGHITLRDRRRRTVEAFTFGGAVDLTEEAAATRCVVRSDAPILELVPARLPGADLATWLACEVEALIASRRAHWARDEAEFARRLASVDAADLYQAFLSEIDQRLRRRPAETLTDEDRAGRRLVRAALDDTAAAGSRRYGSLEELL
jgi:hypothetical protein